jgi:cell division protein FtsL
MKLVLQITLGVFLGSVASALLMDVWEQHKADLLKAETDKLMAEQVKVREEQANLISSILQQRGQSNPAAANVPPASFIPDDAQTETLKP